MFFFLAATAAIVVIVVAATATAVVVAAAAAKDKNKNYPHTIVISKSAHTMHLLKKISVFEENRLFSLHST